ncbi:hypothetical protein TNCV_4363081 [Trichonephila clavipes]|nr:hypothetical protein TNCV_4363081 [Trichonephila clavipes]
MRAFGKGPHNFESWSSDEDDKCAFNPPLLTTTPHQPEDGLALDRFYVHHFPTRRGLNSTGLELMTHQPRVRYHDY